MDGGWGSDRTKHAAGQCGGARGGRTVCLTVERGAATASVQRVLSTVYRSTMATGLFHQVVTMFKWACRALTCTPGAADNARAPGVPRDPSAHPR